MPASRQSRGLLALLLGGIKPEEEGEDGARGVEWRWTMIVVRPTPTVGPGCSVANTDGGVISDGANGVESEKGDGKRGHEGEQRR